MEVLILGNNQLSQDIGSYVPIILPVQELPVRNVILLNNPLLLKSSDVITPIDTLWSLNGYGNMYPTDTSNKIVVGGTSLLADSILSVRGNASINKLYISGTSNTSSAYISLYGTQLSFTDPISGTKTLAELVGGGATTAAAISIVDAGNYLLATNVESAIQEICSVAIPLLSQIHSNFNLLESYNQSNTDIYNAIQHSHDILSVNPLSPLFLATGTQYLDITFADATHSGVLSSSDWNTFNSAISSSNTLNAIKNLTLNNLSLIYGLGSTTATVLNINQGSALKYLRVNNTLTALEWATVDSSPTFTVPAGFAAIGNPIGDINNTIYPDITVLEGKSLVTMLSEMLFPTPEYPPYVLPSNNVNYTISSSLYRNGYYLEKGRTVTITINDNLYSIVGPGGQPYAIKPADSTYLKDGVSYTNGSSNILVNSTYVFSSSIPTIPNPSESVVLNNGTTIYAEDYIGAATYDAVATNTFTVVDPILYGAYTSSTYDITTPPDSRAELELAGYKRISPITGQTISIAIPTYTGAVDVHKLIIIAFPDNDGSRYITSIKYVEGSNAEVRSSFTRYRMTYVRANSTSETNNYTVYVALNSYTDISGTVTYNITF